MKYLGGPPYILIITTHLYPTLTYYRFEVGLRLSPVVDQGISKGGGPGGGGLL